jgi:hypothetical protein
VQSCLPPVVDAIRPLVVARRDSRMLADARPIREAWAWLTATAVAGKPQVTVLK